MSSISSSTISSALSSTFSALPTTLPAPFNNTSLLPLPAPLIIETTINGAIYAATIPAKGVFVTAAVSGIPTSAAFSLLTSSTVVSPSTSLSSSIDPSGSTIVNADGGGSASASPILPAVLGALIGVVALVGAGVIFWLVRRNRRVERTYAGRASGGGGRDDSYGYQLDSGEGKHGDDESFELRRQLEAVRKELAQMTVLAPSTIRDESDYQRDIAILNDAIRQLSMHINRSQRAMPAATIRSALCSAITSQVFDRFDASLDESMNNQLELIERNMSSARTAAIWKALTIKTLPLADSQLIGHKVESRLQSILGASNAWSSQIAEIGRLSVALSRALAEDGKGFVLVPDRESQSFTLARIEI